MTDTLPNNLLQKFVDEGDMLLGCALEMEAGRKLYDRIRGQVVGGGQLSTIYRYFINLDTGSPDVGFLVCRSDDVDTTDDAKILVLKMIEKAVADMIRQYLR